MVYIIAQNEYYKGGLEKKNPSIVPITDPYSVVPIVNGVGNHCLFAHMRSFE